MVDDAGISDKTERMEKFADAINRVINITHANSQSIGESFKYAMPVVKNLGWTEQDTLLATAPLLLRMGLILFIKQMAQNR